MHECTAEDTFSYEKPGLRHRQGYLDKNTYGSYLNGDKSYLNSTLCKIHLHIVYVLAQMRHTQLWFQYD